MGTVERYKHIHTQVLDAARRAGREPSSVQLMVVSKTWSAEDVRPLVDSGHVVYGENRVLEASEKIPALPASLQWHLIGHLQKNKIRKALPLFHTIHSLDSLKLARQIDRIAGELGLVSRVLVQVNIGDEPQKHGFSVEELTVAFPELLALPGIQIDGLMAIPPRVDSAEAARPYFRKLRELRERLQEEFDCPLPELSMGMTSDFEVAVEEGATIVRVGSAIFGARA